MKKTVIFSFSLLVYLAFGVVFVYLIAFTADTGVPKRINGPVSDGPIGLALLIDVFLIGLFGIAHSGFARKSFKRWWTHIVPSSSERTLYVLQAIALLSLLMWQWRPLPTVIWSVENVVARLIIWVIFGMGWGLVLLSSFLINHFELMGLQQAWRGRPSTAVFKTPLLYKWMRHPMMVGFLLAFWSTPTLTVGHLLFAGGMTLYIVIGIHFEERDLSDDFGDTYRTYQQTTPKLLPTGRLTQSSN